MTPFTTVTGPAAPLMLDNVDTDTVIRIERLAAFERGQLGPYAMEALRLRPDGSEDPGCVLNQPAFRGAPILLAGRNFGCGSSREGAVWALAGSGVRCVIAESFGDIFFNNCFQNGMLPVALPRDALDALAALAADGSAVGVDLQRNEVVFPGGRVQGFAIDPMKRAALLDGLDDVSRTLQRRDTILAWQAADRLARPWVWEPVA
ncbi:3-isopropylmalate dehydratase small subunit [Xylophilus rhododendri]|uniref:3-isopropylmalate dehydratase n=1 Tax=Xylophilus rhododendri TaxID=2697032 RepID=A0A857JDM3_9BURK|nr:3-isopropylmalate dehydratase small subunit [Xylophilus rhododendri]QHJ01302.1 3-isopropylmalate dehydratase small subunit [Xylophilus rhododendri]